MHVEVDDGPGSSGRTVRLRWWHRFEQSPYGIDIRYVLINGAGVRQGQTSKQGLTINLAARARAGVPPERIYFDKSSPPTQHKYLASADNSGLAIASLPGAHSNLDLTDDLAWGPHEVAAAWS